MSAALLSGGGKEGNNFIVLFLDFNLDFSLYDTLCAGERAVDAQFSCKDTLLSATPGRLPFGTRPAALSHTVPAGGCKPDPEG